MLRMKGEMVHEFKCEWVVVTARTGYKPKGSGAWTTFQCSRHSRS